MEDNDIIIPPGFKRTNDSPIQRIKVVGVGGGGNNAVDYMYRKGIQDVSFIQVNTDWQVLKVSDVPNKILIGPGKGAGGKPERARKYAEENAEQFADIFDDETDMVFITAGMGGGTGTGAGPVVARIAKEKGILTVGIVTLPFVFEGQPKYKRARLGAEEMAKNVDSLLVINNERLVDIYPQINILNAFEKADDTLLNAAQSITDIITNKGIINRDLNDVDSTLREGGTAIISTGYGEGPDRVSQAIQNALHSPLLKNTDIFTSKKLLLILYISDDSEKHPFNMVETEALREFVLSIEEGNIEVMWGLYKQSDLEDKVRISILASGFDKSYDEDDFDSQNEVSGIGGGLSFGNSGKKPNPAPKHKYFTGIVLNPEDYDNPDNEMLLQFEQTPAIERSRFKGSKAKKHGRSKDIVPLEVSKDLTLDDNLKVNTAPEDNKKSDGTVSIVFDDL